MVFESVVSSLSLSEERLILKVRMALTTGRFSVGLIDEDVSDPRPGSWREDGGPRTDLKERGRRETKQEKE